MSLNFDIITIFPEIFDLTQISLLGKAIQDGKVQINVHQLKDYATDIHKTVDDYPFGGGAGLILKPDIVKKCLDEVLKNKEPSNTEIIITSASGKLFKQNDAKKLAKVENIVIVSPRFEGIDARVAKYYQKQGWKVTEFSIGDFVLFGGEVPALAIIEAISRLVPGVIKENSLELESFNDPNILEAPQYTRPAIWEDLEVPEVLRNGDHKKIAEFNHQESLKITQENRPDLAN